MERILVCSDIHGCYDRFAALLDKSAYNPDCDQLFLLGDYIDRGTQSREVVRRTIELQRDGAICLLGNHEDMCMGAMRETTGAYGMPGDMQMWMLNGGNHTLESYENDYRELDLHVAWFRTLTLYHETEHYIFTHAHPKWNVPMAEQTKTDLVWGRHSLPIGLGKWNVHGHTPTMEGVCTVHDQLWVDTGAVFGGALTMVELPVDGWDGEDELQIWQA
jgi:serine/threonine protein phosphatase 1